MIFALPKSHPDRPTATAYAGFGRTEYKIHYYPIAPAVFPADSFPCWCDDSGGVIVFERIAVEVVAKPAFKVVGN